MNFDQRISAPLLGAALILVASSSAATPATPDDNLVWEWQTPTVTSAVNNQSHQRTGNNADQDKRIFFFRTTWGGIQQKTWEGTTDAVGTWSNWTTRNQSEVAGEPERGMTIAAIGGANVNNSYGLWLPTFNAFFDFETSNGIVKTARPTWSLTSLGYTWATSIPPVATQGSGFVPLSTFTWLQGTTQRINVFGLSTTFSGEAATQAKLRELFFDAGGPHYTDHGAPPGFSFVKIGPGSAVWAPSVNGGASLGYVFATVSTGALWYRHWNGASWSWQSLGKPARTADMGTPVGMTYVMSGSRRVSVFLSGLTDDGWHLYSRHHNGTDWEEWQDWGHHPSFHMDRPSTVGFDMTQAIVWYSGSTLRINMFGTSDPVNTSTAGIPVHEGGQLVEFFWDGARWRWGQVANVPDANVTWPNGSFGHVRFTTMSASVVDTPNWDRLSVFGEDDIGRTWERFWNGFAWQWAQH